MKKKPKTIAPLAFKKFVNATLSNAAWNIGVSHYKGSVLYHSDDKKSQDSTHMNAPSDMLVAADMHVDRRYLTYEMNIYALTIRKWKRGEIKEVADIIHHEVSHIATQHLYDCALATYKEEGEMKDAWESLTTTIGHMSRKIDKLVAHTKKQPSL